MKKLTLPAFIFLLLCFQHTASANPSVIPFAFIIYPIEKVRPDGKFALAGSVKKRLSKFNMIDISLAGNEYEPFIVGVYNPIDSPIYMKGIEVSRPADSSLSCEILRIEYMDIKKVSQWFAVCKKRYKGRWPDPLIPLGFIEKQSAICFKNPIKIPAKENRSFMFDLYLPAEQPREKETWEITIIIENGISEYEKMLTVNIAPREFNLPREASLATAFGCSTDAIVKKHKELSDVDFNEQKLMHEYLRLLGKHKVYIYRPSEKSIPAIREDGNLRFDWTEFDKLTGALLDGELFPDVGPATSFRTPPPPKDLKEEEMKLFWQELEKHAESRGWLDRMFFYNIDEPNRKEYAQIIEQCKFIKNIAPGITMMVTEPYTRLLADYIDLWCPDMPTIGDSFLLYPFSPESDSNDKVSNLRLNWSGAQYHNHPRIYRRLQKKGKKAWFYPCNSSVLLDYPNLCIDSIAQYNRVLPWLAYRWGFQGMLYWRTNVKYLRSDKEVWEDPYAYFTNGDGNVLYPGVPGMLGLNKHMPCPSFRLKLLREGFEDFEYLKLCEKIKGKKYTVKLCKWVVTSSLNWSKNSRLLMRIIRKLSEAIEGNI